VNSAEERFVELYQSYFTHVHAYCRRRTTLDRVDDAAAEAFLIAWRRIKEVPDGPDALPWLYRAAFGVVSNSWRSRSRQQKLQDKLQSAGVDYAPPPDDFVVRRQQAMEILSALDQLNKSDQEVLRLVVWEDLTHQEVSLAMGITVEATRQRLSRAKKRLAKEYDQIVKNSDVSPTAWKGGSQ